MPGEDADVPVSIALGRLRARGVTGLRLVLPEPGDPRTAWVTAQLEQAGTELSAMLLG